MPGNEKGMFLRLITTHGAFHPDICHLSSKRGPQAKFTNICQIEKWTCDLDIDAYWKSKINTNNRLSTFTSRHLKLKEEIMRSANQRHEDAPLPGNLYAVINSNASGLCLCTYRLAASVEK